jgi:hypothetical protein
VGRWKYCVGLNSVNGRAGLAGLLSVDDWFDIGISRLTLRRHNAIVKAVT